METEDKKCSNSKHSEKNAISYCSECELYLCNACINTHSEFFIKHKIYNLNKNQNEISLDKCNELNHKLILNIFANHIIYYVVLLVLVK